MRQAAQDLSVQISQGHSLHNAMTHHPTIFQPFMIQLIATGEQTGKLEPVIKALKEYLVRQKWLRDKLKQAALMPMVTLLISGGLIASIFLFIMPSLSTLYQSMGCPMPPATQCALTISNIISSWVGLVLLAGCIGCVALCKKIAGIKAIKANTDKLKLHLPWIWTIVKNSELATFTQTLSLFLSSGMPLTKALEQAQSIAQNSYVKECLGKLSLGIAEGKTLSSALEGGDQRLFDPQLIAIVRVGEHAGTLDTVLKTAQEQYQNKLDASLNAFSTLFSPILMIFVGLCIGGLMVVIYLPIFSLGNLFGT